MLDFNQVFDTDYHEFNSGAHRNSPKNLYAPALVWHLAFWTDTDGVPPLGSVDRSIERKIDLYIMHLCRKLAKRSLPVKLFPRVSNKALLFSTVVDPHTFRELPSGELKLNRRERDIFRSGMRCVTVEFNWKKLDIAVRCEIHTEHVLFTVFIELNRDGFASPYSGLAPLDDNMTKMVKYLSSNGQPDYDGSLSNYFYFEFWDCMLNELIGRNLFTRLQRDKAFHKIFADFRGVIFSEKAAKFGDLDLPAGDGSPAWGIEAKRRLLPILKTHQTLRLRKYECAISYMLDGRGLYLTSLAPQLPEAPLDVRIPVQYVLYVHHKDQHDQVVVNKWQLGRLVNLLHHLGVCRLAALKDIKALHDVGRDIASIDESIQLARNRVEDGHQDAADYLHKVHQEMNRINGTFFNISKKSILYRIERSRYYVKQFELGKRRLRIKRLEGDQPYDQFVERRLGAQYDFIDRLGTRYERTTGNIANVDQHYISLKTAKLSEDATRANREIKSIQEWGEFLLLAILVPYYLTHLVNFIIVEQFEPYSALGIWTLFGAVAFWRKMGQNGALLALFILILVLVAALFLHGAGVGCSELLRFCESEPVGV